MPRCKRAYCRNQAVPGGRKWGNKRYCEPCGNAYYEKQQEYNRIQATLPKCDNVDCWNTLSKTRHDNGHTTCGDCARREEEERIEQFKWDELEAAKTVDELKAWIMQYVVIKEN